jgi:hypothetical protein
LRSDGTSLDAVVRVASPAFPKDKLESEVSYRYYVLYQVTRVGIEEITFFRKVATCKMIAAFTNIPVPRIYAWNSDASNPVGAEYMILDKVCCQN